MSGLARKLLIIAAIDGLVIQPLSSKGQRPQLPVRVRYGDAVLSTVTTDLSADLAKPNGSFEAFGIVGMITVSRLPFLITVTKRKQVAQIYGYPIYVVTGVAITPCASYKEAEVAVAKTKLELERSASRGSEESESETEEEVEIPPPDEVEDVPSPVAERRELSTSPAFGAISAESEIAKNVIKRKGSYGRFSTKWFSRGGWMLEQKRSLGMSANSSSSPLDFEDAVRDSISSYNSSPGESGNESGEDKPAPEPTSLLPKLLRTTAMVFGTSRSFYYSYDWDLTRSLASRHQQGVVGEENLFKRADPFFFWNQHVVKPFVDGGHDGLVIPMIQGFVGQRSFVVDSHPPQTDEWGVDSVEMHQLSRPGSPPNERASLELRPTEKRFLVTLVSRRSVKRAGLRYLRRGIDEEGHVANAVETEQLLSSTCWGQGDGSKTYSFLQFRGSIPLYFSQTPYSLKPAPVLRHSEDANFKSFRKHMAWMARRYGEVQLVNLVEKKRVEKGIGERYQDTVARLNKLQGQNQVPFEWFDFHHACRGMRFENVDLLLHKLAPKLEEFGSSVEAGGKLIETQKGVVRTNCMDCLDRTNVVQSSMAKHMLDLQLKAEGFDADEQRDQQMMWYNGLWADNGDAVSKQYASTAAMKGDYTRTRKRDYRGTLTDMGLSLTRFFNGIVNDFFLQAAIDFLLGNVTSLVFEEFEATMMTKDPAINITRMREQAIDMCQRQLAGEDEDFISGWTLLSPNPSSASPVSSTPMEEVILLLTDAALYICRFDWNMDKISSFERVDLAHVVGIRAGTYVSSTLTAQQMDESRNVGLIIEYIPGKNDVKRVNTRSLSSLPSTTAEDSKTRPAGRPGSPGPSRLAGLIATALAGPKTDVDKETKKIPLKAPYTQHSAAKGSSVALTEAQLVGTISAEIERLAVKAGGGRGGKDPHEGFLVRGDIVNLSDAKRNMSAFDKLGHSIKKLVWA